MTGHFAIRTFPGVRLSRVARRLPQLPARRDACGLLQLGRRRVGQCFQRIRKREASSAAAPAIEINDTEEELNAVLLGKDAKIACIIIASQRGYYADEKFTLNTQVVSGGFPEAMPMLSDGTVDVLPFGSIPTCTYVGREDA